MHSSTLEGTSRRPRSLGGLTVEAAGGDAAASAAAAGGGTGGVQAGSGASSGAASGSTGTPAAQARNWEKDYGELETKYKGYTERLKHPQDGRPLTPEEVDQFLNYSRWASPIAERFRKGELIEKPAAPAAAVTDPYENWEDLSAKEQVALMRREITRELRDEITGPINQRFEETGRNNAVSQNLLLKLAKYVARHPDVDDQALLAKALEMQSKLSNPDAALEFAFDAITAPQREETKIKAAVEAELARRQQEKENKDLKLLTPGPSPRWQTSKPGSGREKRDNVFRMFASEARKLAEGE